MARDRWRGLDFSEGSPLGLSRVGGTDEQRVNTLGAKVSSKFVSHRTSLPFHQRRDLHHRPQLQPHPIQALQHHEVLGRVRASAVAMNCSIPGLHRTGVVRLL